MDKLDKKTIEILEKILKMLENVENNVSWEPIEVSQEVKFLN